MDAPFGAASAGLDVSVSLAVEVGAEHIVLLVVCVV